MLKQIKKLLMFDKHTCPWWMAYSWDHSLRNLIHNPEKIIKPYIKEGDKVLDIGCGMGFFSLSMVNYVGKTGIVYSVDIQQKMLDILTARANKSGVSNSIKTILAAEDKLKLDSKINFALSFWMLHEVDNEEKLVTNIFNNLINGGKYLVVEPKLHTGTKLFENEIKICEKVGFKLLERPKVNTSRAALFQKP